MKIHKTDIAAMIVGVVVGLLWLSFACGQEIRIIGPAQVEPGEYNRYNVVGIGEDQLAAAALTYEPTKNVVILPAKTWGGEPFLFFMAKNPGEYNISIALNTWRQTLKQAISEASESNVGEAIVLDLRLIDSEADADYPSGSGGITIQVGEPDPDDDDDDSDDDDDDDPPPPDTKWSIVFFWETGDQSLSLDQLEILASSQFQDELRKQGHEVRAFDPDAAASFPAKYKGYWDTVKDKPMPQVAVAPKGGGKVWAFALPKTTEEFLTRLGQGR